MFKMLSHSWKLAAVVIFAVSYVPPLMGLVIGIGHCKTCREAWLTVVWKVQGLLSYDLLRALFNLPHSDTLAVPWPVVLQVVWLVGWTWLAMKGKLALGVAATLALGITIWFTFVISALIRM